MKDKKSGLLLGTGIGFLFVTLLVLYITHRAVPFMMDDEWYSKKLFSEEALSSLSDIWEFQIWHYLNWGGRTITHTMLQLTLMAGSAVADVLNVFMTMLLAACICVVAGVRKKEGGLFYLLAAVGMLHGLNANWKLSMFWQAGAANYLYITSFILLFLHCYLRELDKKEESKPLPGITFWIVPLGVLAGWSNENMGPAVWVVSLLVILLLRRAKRPLRLWLLLGNVACLVGSVLVIAAPGNFVRSREAAANEYGVLWNCFLRVYAESKAAMEFLFPVLLVLIAVLAISKGILKISLGTRNILLLICALLSWGAMLLSPHYPDRATFGTLVLLICVILSMVRAVLQRRIEMKFWFLGGALFIWLRGMYFLLEFLALSWGWIK